jgi:GNAT superfamily N-acetyltransferase
MSEQIDIGPVGANQLDELVPLISAYLRFYEIEGVSEERIREFFSRFLAPGDGGLILGARREGGLVGYTCLYWHFSSTPPAETVLLNDLYVVEGERGGGVGRALIEAAAEVARGRGAERLEWVTAPDNHTAQRLYDSLDTSRSEWLEYELDL